MSLNASNRAISVPTLLAVTVAAVLVGGLVVPRILNSKVTAGEDAAIAALINIGEAENAYRDRYPQIGFAPTIASLSVGRGKHCEPTPQQACMLDQALARNEGRPFRGYYFTESAAIEIPRTTYMIVAVPGNRGRSGVRAFCVVERGIPRYKDFGWDVNPRSITREQCLHDFVPLP
jgi:hypothetical protein